MSNDDFIPSQLSHLQSHSLYCPEVLAYKMVQSLEASSQLCTVAFVHMGTS